MNGEKNYVTKAVMAEFSELYKRYGHTRTAQRAMLCMYRNGEMVGDVDWRMVWKDHPYLGKRPIPDQCPADMPPPMGWSLKNLERLYRMPQKKARKK